MSTAPELAGLPPLLHAARKAEAALRLAAEVFREAKGLPSLAGHLDNEANALLGAIRCAEPYARPAPALCPPPFRVEGSIPS